ncbi:lipid II flippase MurJ [Brachybacterium sp. GPGPB12]|uniref:murein biosynthesis integral membrane protein MurJ n=1 Tax=Brachybacterium sp. GPGPB12 TaxID=3023517 RepID=UPI00313429C1
MMPQIFFSALYVMCGQSLNAHDSFGPYQWAPVLNNLVGIVGAALFLGLWGTVGDPAQWTIPMIAAMALINVGGSAAQVVFLFWYVKKLDLRLRPKWGARGLGLGKLSRIGLWSLAMLGLGRLGIWASRWATGGAVRMTERLQGQPELAARYPAPLTLEWAYLAFMIPQGIIAVTLVTAAFPSISRAAAAEDHAGALARYTDTNRMLSVPMVLCTAVFVALSGPIMWVIGGGTGEIGARANGGVLVAYMLGLMPFASLYLIKRLFYAYEDARTPFLAQIPIAAVTLISVPVILTLVDPQYAAMSAAGATSLGNLLAWLFGLWRLRRHAARHEVAPPSLRAEARCSGG